MGVMLLKYKIIVLLFLLIAASLLSSTNVEAAGRSPEFVHKAAAGGEATHEDVKGKKTAYGEMEDIHERERLLRANTKDYGRYDPAPTFVKPPFKLIPN